MEKTSVPFLNEPAMLRSEIVANAKMNRARGLSGVNSYERDLAFDITAFLRERVRLQGKAIWYDACCGVGRALIEAEQAWNQTGWGAAVTIIGADLYDDFLRAPDSNVRFYAADVVHFQPDLPPDLITVVHGIHYLGDKLGFLERAYASLGPDGQLLGHLDTVNIRNAEQERFLTSLLRAVRKQGVDITLRQHRLHLKKNDVALKFPVEYVGATVAEKPNFSGMIALDSWYQAE